MKGKVAKFIDKVRGLVDAKLSKKLKTCEALEKALDELKDREKELKKELKKSKGKDLKEEYKLVTKQIDKAKKLIKEKECD